jgi:hypothetical protein
MILYFGSLLQFQGYLMLTRRTLMSLPAALSFSNPVFDNPRSIFDRLWSNHPMGDDLNLGNNWPCQNLLDTSCARYRGDVLKNQCAIRLGDALRKTFRDLRLQDFPKVERLDGSGYGLPETCHDITIGDCSHSTDELHVLHPSELVEAFHAATLIYNRLSYPKFFWLLPAEEYRRWPGTINSFRSAIANRNGIIFIESYWQKRKDAQSGCHIDLWNGTLQRTKNELYYKGKAGPPDVRFDEVATRVLFWEVLFWEVLNSGRMRLLGS